MSNTSSSTLSSIISSGDIAMVASRDKTGNLRSRPMEVAEVDDAGHIFFFTTVDSEMVSELTDHNYVNLSFIKSSGKSFVSVSGASQITKDQSQIDALWKDDYARWIPQGRDNRDLAVMTVKLIHGERWEDAGMLERLEDFFSVGTSSADESALEPEKIHS